MWRPATLGQEWRAPALDAFWDIAKRTWLSSYQEEARSIASFMLARIEGVMTKNGARAFADCPVDCVLSFERVRHSDVTGRNPLREQTVKPGGYPSLAEFLRKYPHLDSIPISCARMNGKITVWDGHHRLRTYEVAGRDDLPSFFATFISGDGLITLS